MKKLKIDFKIDILQGTNIPLDEYREKFKKTINRKSGIYISEIADLYYREKYNKNILEILSTKYEIPKCPITNEFVTYVLTGSIIFGRFSKNCSNSQITNYCLLNDDEYKNKIEELKNTRKGAGNPMYGKKAWNYGLNKENNDIMMQNSLNRIGITFTEETKEKQSKSAKKRTVHGHTGIKHSEKSKEIMRRKTIERFKKGKFPHTNSVPHKIVKEILEKNYGACGVDFFEEEGLYGFVFDFMIGNYLIEVQGDYFHCNPKTRHANPKNTMQINNVKRDIRKKEEVEKNNEYILIELWENDIINNKKEIELCLMNLKK